MRKLQWPKHPAALFHHYRAQKNCKFFFVKKMNVTLVEQIAVGKPRTWRYSSGHTQLTLSALGGVAGPRWR